MKSRTLPFVLFALASLTLAQPASARDTGTGLGAAAALHELQEGNTRFAAGKARHPNQDTARRIELAQGQKPKAILLSCSDSRVPPELVFDQGLGDVFPIRVAGNIVDTAGMASIEYAVEHLGAKLIVVMGHESCGAVKAAIETPHGESAGSPDLDMLIGTIQPAIGNVDPKLAQKDKTLREPVMHNVDAVAEHLLKRSKILREKAEKGELRIARAIYSLSSGKVQFWDKHSRVQDSE